MKSKKHILIVDDVTINLRYIAEILKDNYSLSMAKSGEQALKILNKTAVDLILLDVKMPVMDGFDVLRELSADKKYKDIPVILLTADNNDSTQDKGLSLGAADYIRKPFVPEEIIERIEKVLSETEE